MGKEGVYKDVKWMWEVFGRHGSPHLGLGNLLKPMIFINNYNNYNIYNITYNIYIYIIYNI